MKKIVIFGICGKMGSSMAKELLKEKDLDIIGGFDKFRIGEDIGKVLGTSDINKKVWGNYDEIKKLNPDLIIDFTSAEILFNTINWAIESKIDIIVGTTGLKNEELLSIEKKANSLKVKFLLFQIFQ